MKKIFQMCLANVEKIDYCSCGKMKRHVKLL